MNWPTLGVQRTVTAIWIRFAIAVAIGSAAAMPAVATEGVCGGNAQIDFVELCTDGVRFKEGRSELDLECKRIGKWSKERRSWLLAFRSATTWRGSAAGEEALFEHLATKKDSCRMIFRYEITGDGGVRQGHMVGRVHNGIFVGHLEQDSREASGVFSFLLDDSGRVFSGSVSLKERGARGLGPARNWTGRRN